MNARKENQIAWMLLLSIALILGGIFMTMIGFGSAMGIKSKSPIFFIAMGPVMVIGGVVLAAWGVFTGHLSNRKMESSGPQFLSRCYIVGRYGINEIGEMLFTDFEDLDHPKSKFFVRIKTSEGKDEEYECSRELISQIGEGMVGNVQVRGKWLGSFTPLPRV